MSLEITTLVQLQANKSTGAEVLDNASTVQADMSGSESFGGTQNITTGSWQAVSFGNLAGAPGFWKVTNCNTVAGQYVQFSSDSAGANPLIRLQPGMQNLISVESGKTVYAKATGATVKIRSKAVDV